MGSKRLFGLIGHPLSHSFSKTYFTEKFEKENIPDGIFNLYPISNINELPMLINANPDLIGLSVTIPYKESVIPFINELDDSIKNVGAVNCIKIVNQRLFGYNTDIFGFRQSIKPFLESKHERALILGTGGASKAVAHVLKEIGVNCFFVTRNKTVTNSGDTNCFVYEELTENIIHAFPLIINTSPVGMFPDISSSPKIPYEFVTSSHLLYDLIYNPLETEFLKRGKKQGATTLNGLSMLHLQAEEAWKIWNS